MSRPTEQTAPINALSNPVADPAAFICAHTRPLAPPLVPEIILHQATEDTSLWHATENTLDRLGLPSPYWAFAWAGGQALARYVLDNPVVVAGRRVFDFGSGSGLAAIAAAKAGAARVVAVDVDPFATAAIKLNAALNTVVLEARTEDLVGHDLGEWDVVLAGDVCYEQPLAGQVEGWLRSLAAGGAEVLLGDPKRTYVPRTSLQRLARYSVQTTRAIEDTDVRNAIVWRVLA